MDGFNTSQFSGMVIQGYPPHYPNGIANNCETKWIWRFKTQRDYTDMSRGRRHETKLLKKEQRTFNYGSGQHIASVGAVDRGVNKTSIIVV